MKFANDTSQKGQRPIVLNVSSEFRLQCQQLVAQHGSPLLVFKPSVLRLQFTRLQNALPNVALYYAVKAHPDSAIIDVIDDLGGGFDIASAGEMDLLMQHKISGRRTIHTHPIKKDKEIRDALRFGATTFVVDNLYELKKLEPYKSRVGVLLRVSFRSASASVDLSKKFGCTPKEVFSFVKQAEQLGIHVKGLSFHVGSQCQNSDKHVEAINACHDMINLINQTSKRPLSILDIGGGFPADYALQDIDIEHFCAPINDALNQLPSDWHILAEPGRYLIAPAVYSITTVTGKSVRDGQRWYYLDDGVYGSYSGQIFDHTYYPLQIINQLKSPEEITKTSPEQDVDQNTKKFRSVLAGPTCDSIDIIAEDIPLPELDLGDLIIGLQMGAYTAATKTRFNSIPDAKFIITEDFL